MVFLCFFGQVSESRDVRFTPKTPPLRARLIGSGPGVVKPTYLDAEMPEKTRPFNQKGN